MTQSQRRAILVLAFILLAIEVGDANRKEVDQDPIDHTRCDLLTKAMAKFTQTSMDKSGPFVNLKGRLWRAFGASKVFRRFFGTRSNCLSATFFLLTSFRSNPAIAIKILPDILEPRQPDLLKIVYS
jgi:hypothetical protein